MQRRAHAERRDTRGWNLVRRTIREHHLARPERKRIEAVDVKIDVLEEAVEIVRLDAAGEHLDIALRVDVPGHVSKRVDLGTSERRHDGARLPVEIGELERVEVGDVEARDTEAGEGGEVEAADATHAGDGHPLVPEALLFLRPSATRCCD